MPLLLARTGAGRLSAAEPRSDRGDAANRSNVGIGVLAALTESCAHVIDFIALHGESRYRDENYDDVLNN